MYSFECDYLEGCHPRILEAFASTNLCQEAGYGADRFSESAREKIRTACHCEDAEIFFINGGTQTNQLVIDTMLTSYEGVLAAESGHVSTHEAGAIEFSGHKVLTLPSHQGKVSAPEVMAYIETFYADENHEHMVFPGMLYISHPTEYGTLYTAEELRELSELCRANNVTFYLDGARLGYGLMSRDTDVTLPLIAKLCDAFYIGGTKVGALSGEALVFPSPNTVPKHFVTQIKQHGALSAKGRLIGIQFDTLFTDNLYFEISAHAIEMAEEIKQIFSDAGIPFFMESPTNQQFLILENEKLEELKKYVRFSFWERYDEAHTVVRFASSWATTPEGIQTLKKAVAQVF